ncbi:MotA/TolQ/ExbB proton channel family protein [Endozoicomonas gorgoniicola]|uniref:MotA/TolQ/ExbB proton channel family protein n=1 Tax=Endozoicomonas gorgoniicola TaxID=1234144 RepID=A0ABT3N206_9GAMM|nr:MotA/TolQ/ExbB proton channel family protein [Endozoicomonas gorgoniicola]MCW7555660.1 MotA/TolQ/ExbB proton channel family protein [Endozoicomonas gorgoniicola]
MIAEQIASMGMMGWPLAVASCLSFALILERLITYAMLPSLGRKGMHTLFDEVRGCASCRNTKDSVCKNLRTGKGIRQGIAVLLSHSGASKTMREEVAGLWLLKQKHTLHSWLKPLMLIGILAPMLGLLGTVMGLIDMFRNIAAVQGPVTPDILADGLWVAMFTTAFGLIVAIPSLAAAHGLGVWANHYMSRLEFAMNHANLLLEGLKMDEYGLADESEGSACLKAVAA